MSTWYGPRVINDGLICYYDLNNPASYQGMQYMNATRDLDVWPVHNNAIIAKTTEVEPYTPGATVYTITKFNTSSVLIRDDNPTYGNTDLIDPFGEEKYRYCR